ncbi:hypothetical protein RQP46_003300 [Phenoliferia psychrophenolica]
MTIYKSQWPSSAPSTEGVFDFLFNNKSINPSRAAIIDAATGVETSYATLREEALRFSDGLRRVAGLTPKDTILIFCPNSAVYPIIVLAAAAAGVTISTANSSYTPHELAHQLSEASAVAVFVGSDLVEVAREAAKEIGLSEDRMYVLPGVDGTVNNQGLKSYLDLRGEVVMPAKIPEDKLTTTAAYGLIVVLSLTLSNGGTVVLLPKFDLAAYCTAVQKYQATISFIVPPIALGLAKHPSVSSYDLSSLRFILSGAAPLSADLQKLLASRLGNTAVTQGYGMTETTSVALLPDLSDPGEFGNCGKLLGGMEARLVDAEMKDVKEGESGELLLRGPNIMIKYHKNPEATAKTIDKDGWMMTGDVCVRSATGHYTIVDRIKEFMKYKGFQVIPSELEGILLTCPMVADAAVIGVWSEEQATELPRAYVVIDPAHVNTKDVCTLIQKFVQGKVAPHKRLRGGVIPMDVIPKSPSGKILRKDLRVLAAKEATTPARL